MVYLQLRTWQLGIKSLLLHPLRSLLTVLGIFIGTASVIWLLAIGEGISSKAQEQIAQLGADNIILRSVQPVTGKGGGKGSVLAIKQYGLTRNDYANLANIPTIARSVRIRESKFECKREERMVECRVVGCDPEYLDLNRLVVDSGHFITDSELRVEDNVCVLAAELAQKFFRYENPLNQTIHIQNDYYRVVGVMKEKTATAAVGGSMSGQDFSSDIYIPYTTFVRRIGDKNTQWRAGSRHSEFLELNQVTVKVRNPDDVIPTADAVRAMLAERHPEEDYAVVVPMELLEQAKNTRMMFMVFMGLMAAVSLVVGGIGIMNIMLATVTERTREIGIRRALGAKRGDITRQFLVETIVLSVAGGLSGVLGGLLVGPLVQGLRSTLEATMPTMMANMPESMRDVTPIVVPMSIPLAFGISMLIGVVFGLYPARRAARMNPIEALRHVA
ncbi:MAG: ABC transporter permease [Planctomycetaceae bacterium]|nr:ABC transporter permease [Planctomycetaceae bacterium]